MANHVDPGLVLKTTPPKLRKSLLARERLRQIRAGSDDVAMYLVEASAGYGKTSLLAQWRLDWLQTGAVVAWFAMDAEDSPITVVSGVVLGLRRSIGRPDFGTDAIEAVRRGVEAAEALTSLLAEIIEMARPTVLIFDNCERIGNPAVLDLFDYLLHNLPPNLQLAVGSRPPVPLRTIHLLSHGDLRRFTSGELRFDLAETIRLLAARAGSRFDADLCARLHEITEGWPLGLQLAASTLERSVEPCRAVLEFSASRDDGIHDLFDSLVEGLEPALADFVTRCAFLEALHPSLCTAVTLNERAAESLQRLLAETPLLSAAEEGEWLRLHPLAREYLTARAERALADAERREAHVRAVRWYVEHDFPERAAQHALAAGLHDEALGLIAGALNDQLERGHAGTVLEWLARIPSEQIHGNVVLRLTALWMQVLSYRPGNALPDGHALVEDATMPAPVRGEALLALSCAYCFADDLSTARKFGSAYLSTESEPRGRRILANLDTLLSLYVGTPENARQHQARNPDDDRYPVLRVWGDFFTVLSYLWEGRPKLAERLAQQAHARWEARIGRRGQWTCQLGSLLATTYWQRGLREDAQTQLAHRLDVIEQGTAPDGIAYVYRTLAQMASSQGDEARAFAYLEALAAIGENHQLARFIVVSLAERVRLHAARRRPDETAPLLAKLAGVCSARPLCPLLEPLLRLEEALAHAYAAMAKADHREAADRLATASILARRINRGCEMVQILALRALLADRTGESPMPLLIEALSLAEVGGLVRVFADTLPDVIELIQRCAHSSNFAPVTREFIVDVLAAANAAPHQRIKPPLPAGNAILTAKEDSVLKLLAGGLANKRIAAELGMSSETVKWHVKKLFTKLKAVSRDHAVDRARMLGLIP